MGGRAPGRAPGRRPGTRIPARPTVGQAVLAVVLLVAALLAVPALRGALAGTRPHGSALTIVTAPGSQTVGWSAEYVDAAGRPARWDPCQPIHYALNPAWAPTQGRADLTLALRRLSTVSGLQFVSDGDTAEVPATTRQPYQPARYGDRWAPLLIAWVPPTATDLGLGNGVQAVTSAVAVPSTGGGSILTAQVALDADHRLGAGFGPGTTEGEVLLHELAHAVGLGHVDDATQVMYFATTNGESVYGAGDRKGLAAVGAAAGCHAAPAAAPLKVRVGDGVRIELGR